MTLLRILGKNGIVAIAVLSVLTATLALFRNHLGPGYLLPLHGVLESFSAAMSVLIFATGWQTYSEGRTGSVMALCCAYAGIALLELAHLLSYPSMPDFITANSYQKAFLLSLSSRALTAAALLAVALAPPGPNTGNRFRYTALAATLALTALLCWLAIFHSDAAAALSTPRGDTGIAKRYVDILLMFLFAAAGVSVVQRRGGGDQPWLRPLTLGCAFMAAAEFSFAVSPAPASLAAINAHLAKVLAGYFVYRAIFLRTVQHPIEQLNASQASLQASQRELALAKIAMDRNSDHVYMIDSDNGRMLYANDGALRRLGYSGAEMLELSAAQIDAGNDPARMQQIAAEVQTTGTSRFESVHRTKAGDTFPVEVSVTLIDTADRKIFYCTARDISERRRLQREIDQQTQFLRRVIDGLPYYISLLTPDGCLVGANRMVLDVWGLPEQQLRGQRLTEQLRANRFPPELCDQLDDAMRRAAGGETVQMDLCVPQPDGSEEYSALYIAPARDPQGSVVNLIATSTSITERVRAQEQLNLASIAFDHSAEAIVITDGARHVLSANRAFTAIVGFEQAEVVGTVLPLFESGKHCQAMHEAVQQSGNWSGEVEWLCSDGRLCFEWVTVTEVRNQHGDISNYVVIFSDISEKKRTEEHIQYLAYYDPLTSLPNRVLLEDRIRQAIATAKRDTHRIAVMFLDLDHFKTINDSLGHQRGDKILAEMGKRLKRSVREMDTVARLGGDEFVVVLPGLHDRDEASAVSAKLLAELAVPYLVGGSELRLTVSMGVSIFPDDGDDLSALIMNADAAMYHAKAVGRNNIQFFVGEMKRRAAELLTVENRLRRAIEHEEFVLHYQPQVDLWNDAIVGLEALVRWNDPEQGMVPPGEFIPVAEERGLIAQIGDWVLREACRQARAWQDSGLPPLPVAVNISATQFRHKNLAANVRAILQETGLAPEYLELEVTESVVMYDAEQLISTLQELRDIGVYLTVDDFGTGYSSLSYLKRFPIDKIKVDRSFVRDIPGDKDDFSIVRAIIGLAQQLSLKVVAEGVETTEQLEALRLSGCDQFQGFLFSRPVAAAEVETLLRRQHRRAV